jgi:hypothetical protein
VAKTTAERGRQMKVTRLFVVAMAFVLALSLMAGGVSAQAIYSLPQNTVPLSMTIAESLTVSVTGGPVVFTYNSAAHTATAGAPLSVVTSWQLGNTRAVVQTTAWADDGPVALTDGTDTIPTSALFASVDSGTATACTGNSLNGLGLATSTCPTVYSVAITGANRAGTHTDSLLLSLSGLSATLPAGSYTGQLDIQAYTD